jgi:PAS domain S-box-containing protein
LTDLRELVQAASEAMIAIDSAGRVVYPNDHAEKLFG